MIECVEREYILEKKAALREFDEKKIDLKENLISDFEDKRKTIEADRFAMELTGDSMEVKPVMTRKLRRRPNEPAPMPEKRRKAPTAQIIYVLDDKEIENDMKKIIIPFRKLGKGFIFSISIRYSVLRFYFILFCYIKRLEKLKSLALNTINLINEMRNLSTLIKIKNCC